MYRAILFILILACGLTGANHSPVAVITVDGKTIVDGRITVNRNETVCFSGLSSTDADNDPLVYLWDFGDGGDASASATPCHTFRNAGSYAVRLIVCDIRDSLPLLTGKTPADYTLPSGWFLVRTQDFESGLGANEFACGTITTSKPYTGTHSCQSRVWKDDCCAGWKLYQGVITRPEIYVSWYEYMDSHGKMNDEMFLIYFKKSFTNPSSFLGIRWQYLNKLGNWNTAFNLDTGNLILFCEGNAAGATPSHAYYRNAKWQSVGFGHWRQWEVYFKPATGGLQNGITRIYLNGILTASVVDSALNGSVDMSGPSIFVGGSTYTKIDWGVTSHGPCAENVNQLNASMNRPDNFKEPCICPGQCPPNGYVPIFNRYLDDIIILER
jgi:hypothetical protein